MLLFAIALVVAPTPAVAAPDAPKAPTAEHCPRTAHYYAYRDGKPLQPRKLTELPPANAYSAVYRRIAGCEVPVVVRYGVGRR
jgi:hypothetical protein